MSVQQDLPKAKPRLGRSFFLGVIAIVAAIAIPTLHASRDRDSVRMAAQYLGLRMQSARLEALKRLEDSDG